jgi:Cu+-exporting ATPase
MRSNRSMQINRSISDVLAAPISTLTPTSAHTAEAGVNCRHCGLPCDGRAVSSAQGLFCCQGCEAVFGLLAARHLADYYASETPPGVSQQYRGSLDANRFTPLDDPGIAGRFVEFDDGRMAVATFSVPTIHCASCVWLLEQFWRFDPGTTRTEVDLQRRAVRVEYRPVETSVRRIAEQLSSLGYEPVLAAETTAGTVPWPRRRLYLQLGVAGFAFGNIMLFSIPRYANGVPVADGFQALFDALNLLLVMPVLLFSASDYFRTAWHALRRGTMALEVPVALGLMVLFTRSLADIADGRGPGFLDSFAGLVFFLLVGRLFQQKAFDSLAFDRTYRSFLPLSVQIERDGGTVPMPLERLQPGDCMVLRRHEIVPTDAVLFEAHATVDYRFITGEEAAIGLDAGDTVRAGGRAGCAMRLRVLRAVSQSQLASLWASPLFGAAKPRWLADVAVRFGAWFTVAAMGLAIAGAIWWWPDAAASASVATAVLIVACPCALTLSAPITLGTAMGLLGSRGLYLKQPAIVLDLSRIGTVIFDKTGTLTSSRTRTVAEVHGLSDRAWALVRRLALESTHPVSAAIAADRDRALGNSTQRIEGAAILATMPRPENVREIAGQGLTGTLAGVHVAIGSASFVAGTTGRPPGRADRTWAAAGDECGWIRLAEASRPGIEEAAGALADDHRLFLVSGDVGTDRARWSRLFGSHMHFQQSPEDKLAFVAAAQQGGRRALMIGDGLNDAGALAAADVGIAVSDATACIVPACDGVVSGDRLADLPAFLRFARRARHLVIACFTVSIAYNLVGLTLALSGALTPLASAILMPISSLTIVALSAGGMRWSARRMLPA